MSGEVRRGSRIGNITEHIARGETVFKKEKRICLRARALLISCTIVSTARGREKGRVALRQLNKVIQALQCVLDLCFHVTGQCSYCFDRRLEGEDL